MSAPDVFSEANHVYETFNVDRPDIVRGVHFAYLQAGARCLTTNTIEARLRDRLLMNAGDDDLVIYQKGDPICFSLTDHLVSLARHNTHISATRLVLGNMPI